MAQVPEREVDFTFDGKPYKAERSLEVVFAIERATDSAIHIVAQKCLANTATLFELSACVAVMTGLSQKAVGDRIIEVGMLAQPMRGLSQEVGNFLLPSVLGHEDHVEVAKADGGEGANQGEAGQKKDPP